MSDTPMKIGFIGIGNMGWGMAANLVKAGHQLTAFDTDAQRVERFARECGGRGTTQLSDLADAGVVITMLPTGAIVREVLTQGKDDANGGLAALLQPGSIVVDMSSSEPVGTRDLGHALAQRGIALIDAPVSGGVARADNGTLAIMYGSDDAIALERMLPVLRAMGDRLFATGALGCGHAMKALNNYVAATAFAATSEALLIGSRFGLDPATMVDILNVSTGRNFHTDVVMKDHVVGGKFATGFAVGLLAKDVKIAADLGAAVHQPSPVLDLVRDRWAYARDALGANRDNTEAFLAWKGQAAQ
ncbi:NAD(P)-dependent oxidoreductase [Variovorax sp. Sphag1AA]|uniref:NAD(P)-dependent oxidoreductase n=1 Tax=Variovorax sp. Sphag1AA TaxID=2587027 RepID=UPI00160ABFFF|nr:NAD(P)-dependent oxidoreductase [Variovorax sp. Sphag1AA]MBB3180583.1 3-hydroxyisobutyrate dehydrogenase [Variovorax sp. Sphag1AA]